MKKYLISIFIILMAFVLLGNQTFAQGQTERIGGSDRFEVAVNASKKGWSSSSTVILANYNAFADALAAAPLAYKLNAPILLTQPNILTATTKREIARLGATNVVIVGGTGSVFNNVENELKNMGKSVKRINGKDRFEVANNIANEIGKASKVVLAYGMNFPDALAIAPYAARNGYPILLTNTNEIPTTTSSLINSWGVSETIVVGGPGSIAPGVLSKVRNPNRIDGKDRFEVAANIANKYFPSNSTAFVATGLTFADALTGSVLAAKSNSPILLTRPTSIPDIIQTTIKKNGTVNYFVLGGPASVSDQLLNKFKNNTIGKTIMIDPGHGGKDSGAVGNNMLEKEIVLDVSNRLKSKLTTASFDVLMTRTNDTFIELDDRVQKAHNQGADLFVSIHVNSFTSSSANGTETYYNSTYASKESKELAQEIQKELVNALGTNNRGVKEASFYVIKNTKIPSVLVEIAFISNPSDAQKLANNTYRQKAADAIYKGINNFFSK